MIKKYKKIILILLIFIAKFSFILYLGYLDDCKLPLLDKKNIYSYSGDADSYIKPWENLLTKNVYSLYEDEPYAGRLPFVGLPYFIFRLLFNREISLNLLVIIQIILSSVSIYYLGQLLIKILSLSLHNYFQKNLFFYGYLLFSIFSLYVTYFDYKILSESLATSFLCFFSYHYYIFLNDKRNNSQLLLVGIFLALTTLWKPYFGLIYLILGIEFLIYEFKKLKYNYLDSIKKTFVQSLIVFFPLIILDLPWIVRNYFVFNQFIPFQSDLYAGYRYSDGYKAYMDFTKKIGESVVFWDKRSFGCWFESNSNKCDYKVPNRIISNNLTLEKILKQRELFIMYRKNSKNDSLEKAVILGFEKLYEDFKKDNPYTYWILPRIIHLKTFLFHSGSYYFPLHYSSNCYNFFHFVFKIIQSFFYYISLILGSLGLVIIWIKYKNTFILLFIEIFHIIFFPFLILSDEFRYFHPVYPFLSLGLIFILHLLFKKRYILKKSNHPI